MKALIPVLLFCGLARLSSAQGIPPSAAKPPLPDGPLPGRAPAYARWEIAIRGNAPANPTVSATGNERKKQTSKKDDRRSPAEGVSGAATSVSVTKTGEVIHVETTDPRGAKMQEWHAKEFQILTRPGWAEPLLSMAGNRNDTSYTDYNGIDFPGLRWISKENYSGIETVDGHVCLVFRDRFYISDDGEQVSTNGSPTPAANGSVPAAEQSVAAYLDYYSRLPVRAVRADQSFDYRFLTPPAEELVLPPEFQKIVDLHQEQTKRQLAVPSKP